MGQGGRITSGRIAEQAGLAQPTFYTYFKSVDACLLAAAEYAAERIAEQSSRRRQRFVALAWSVDALQRDVRTWLEQTRETGPLRAAFVRYRNDRTALGEVVRRIHERNCSELASQLQELARRCGCTGEHPQEFRVQAELMVSATATVGQLIHDGTLEDIDAVSNLLARNIMAALEASVRRCGGDPDQLTPVTP